MASLKQLLYLMGDVSSKDFNSIEVHPLKAALKASETASVDLSVSSSVVITWSFANIVYVFALWLNLMAVIGRNP
jgi:hypothetical protein